MTRALETRRLAPRERALLARRIRAIFIFERNCWEAIRSGGGGVPNYQPGPHWDGRGRRKGIWKSVADSIFQRGIGVHAYIYYVLGQLDFFSRPPLPSDLLSIKWLDGFPEHLKDQPRRLRIEFTQAEKSLPGCIISYAETLREVFPEMSAAKAEEHSAATILLDEPDGMSANFRIYAAHEFGLKDIVDSLLTDAAVEYSRAKESYDLAWPDFPADLRAAMQKEMDRIL